MYFHYVVIIPPWIMRVSSIKQTWVSFTWGYFMPILIDQWFWRRIFLKVINAFSPSLSPLGKDSGHSIEKKRQTAWIPFTQDCVLYSSVKLIFWFLFFITRIYILKNFASNTRETFVLQCAMRVTYFDRMRG